tara:strand:- start:530 stop:790 length:261 start_codon:yes stop_codon:yes gene_type:complete
MNEYRVSVTHTITVEAEDEDDAQEEALEKLEDGTYCEPEFHVEKIKELDPEPQDACTLAKQQDEDGQFLGYKSYPFKTQEEYREDV